MAKYIVAPAVVEEKVRRMRGNGHPVPVICEYTGLTVHNVVVILNEAGLLDDNLTKIYGSKLYAAS